MAVMLACSALVAAGLAAVVAWGGRTFEPPATAVDLTMTEVARRGAWYWSITLLAGIGAGITMVGGGGRLAMRLLAATSGPEVQGLFTEADAEVGEITTDGTIDFVVFNGIFVGVLVGTLHLLTRRFVPAGRVGGLVYGAGLLVVFGATADPLRRDNVDFDLIGPGWLSVTVFTVLALAAGLTVQALAARMSSALPLPSARGGVALRYVPAAALAAIVFPATAMALGATVVAAVISRWRALVDFVRSDRYVVVGRCLLTVALLISLPTFVGSAWDIATR